MKPKAKKPKAKMRYSKFIKDKPLEAMTLNLHMHSKHVDTKEKTLKQREGIEQIVLEIDRSGNHDMDYQNFLKTGLRQLD